VKEESEEINDSNNLTLHVTRIGKFLKKNDKCFSQKRYANKEIDSSSYNFTYLGCGKQEHIKIECLNSQIKDKFNYKKLRKRVRL